MKTTEKIKNAYKDGGILGLLSAQDIDFDESTKSEINFGLWIAIFGVVICAAACISLPFLFGE